MPALISLDLIIAWLHNQDERKHYTVHNINEILLRFSHINIKNFGYIICCLLVAYLMGSIPFGYLFTRIAGLGDIRKLGSGNIGATNVLRTGNKKIAILTLLCDFLKGYLAVFILGQVFTLNYYLLAVCAVLGHIFPLWLRFKGGKGVATALGTFFALNPWLGAITVLLWGITAKLFKISSLSALVAFSLASVGFYIAHYFFNLKFYTLHFGLYCGLTTFILFLTHRDNIKRLLKGEESVFDHT